MPPKILGEQQLQELEVQLRAFLITGHGWSRTNFTEELKTRLLQETSQTSPQGSESIACFPSNWSIDKSELNKAIKAYCQSIGIPHSKQAAAKEASRKRQEEPQQPQPPKASSSRPSDLATDEAPRGRSTTRIGPQACQDESIPSPFRRNPTSPTPYNTFRDPRRTESTSSSESSHPPESPPPAPRASRTYLFDARDPPPEPQRSLDRRASVPRVYPTPESDPEPRADTRRENNAHKTSKVGMAYQMPGGNGSSSAPDPSDTVPLSPINRDLYDRDRHLITLIDEVLGRRLNRLEHDRGPQIASSSATDNRLTAEVLGYFDPEPAPDSQEITHQGKHTFYKTVYAFTDHLKDLQRRFPSDAIRVMIPESLRGTALRWYTRELTEMERELMSDATLERWIKSLEHQFKERTTSAIEAIKTERYTLAKCRNGETPREYVQKFLGHARAAGFDNLYNQLIFIWKSFDISFQMLVPEPTDTTSLSEFLDQIDAKQELFEECAKRGGVAFRGNVQSSSSSHTSNLSFRGARGQSNNTYRRGDGRQPYGNRPQPYSVPNRPNPQGFPSQYPSYFPNQFSYGQYGQRPYTYNNYQANNYRGNYNQARGGQLSGRQPLLLTQGSSSASVSNQSNQGNQNRFGQRGTTPGLPNRGGFNQHGPPYAPQPANRQPVRAYHSSQQTEEEAKTIDESSTYEDQEQRDPSMYDGETYPDGGTPSVEDEAFPEDSSAASHWHVAPDDLPEAYHDHEPEYGYVSVPQAMATVPIPRSCFHCKEHFPSGAALHRHLPCRSRTKRRKNPVQAAYPIQTRAAARASERATSSSSNEQGPNRVAEATTVDNASTPDVQQPRKIISQATPSRDHGTGFAFRNHFYATGMCRLNDTADLKAVCLDSGTSASLIDRTWLEEQDPLAEIRLMSTPMRVRGLGTKIHLSNEYVITQLQFPGKDSSGNDVVAVINHELHLVDNLQARLLIGTDVMIPEQIDLLFSRKEAVIGSCGVTIKIVPNPKRGRTGSAVRATQERIVPPHSIASIPVNFVGHVPDDRDLIFEPLPSKLSVFAGLANATTKQIVVRNDTNHSITVPRRQRLGTLTDGKFDKCCEVTSETALAAELAVSEAEPDPQEAYAQMAFAHVSSADIQFEHKLNNGITVYAENEEQLRAYTKLVEQFAELFKDKGIANVPEEHWMRIHMRPGWQDRIPKRPKLYRLGAKDMQIVNETFDALHEQGRMEWTRGSAPFSFPVFVVWKTLPNGEEKGRVVVDVRALNDEIVTDSYPVPRQEEVIAMVRGAKFISVMDGASFFYLWPVHPNDHWKLTVNSQRGQETFKVAIMGLKTSIAHVQRQIDLIIKVFKWAKAYVDDIIMYGATFQEHLDRLSKLWSRLLQMGIRIKPTKVFLGYPTVRLLGQRVDSLGLTTPADKLEAIAKLSFPKTLAELETYLGMTGYLRTYVPYYAQIVEPLQKRKTLLLSAAPKKGNPRRSYAAQKIVETPSPTEIDAFKALQEVLAAERFLTHFDHTRQLLIDLDASKKRGFGAMAYHLADSFKNDIKDTYPPSTAVQPILFLSRTLTKAEQNMWPTELEMAGMVWVVRKLRHMIESAVRTTVIFTDHKANVNIAKQKTLNSVSTDKLNLRLVRAAEYLQRFNLEVLYKPGKGNLVPDALSRLATMDDTPSSNDGYTNELDALHGYAYALTATLVELSDEFKQKIVEGYQRDALWKRIDEQLITNDSYLDDAVELPFQRDSDGLIYHMEKYAPALARELGDHRRLCIPKPVVKDILQMAHDEQSHPGYARLVESIEPCFFIRQLRKQIREYCKHCPECKVFQTLRHRPFGLLQPIDVPPIPFHTITIDFIQALPKTVEGFDCSMTVTCKFSKRVLIIPGISTWTAEDWATALIASLLQADWGLPKSIISDRDRKFVRDLWKQMFKDLGASSLYSTAYHPQTDGQSERTNAHVEIALRFHIDKLKKPQDWPKVVSKIQFSMNCAVSASTKHSPLETIYGFTPNTGLNLATQRSKVEEERLEILDSIHVAQMNMKWYYDRKHQAMFLSVGDLVAIKLGSGYKIPENDLLGFKLSKKRCGPFKIVRKVGKLAYELEIPSHWRIHPVFSIAQLEPMPDPRDDPFERPPLERPGAVYVERDTPEDPSFEIEKLLAKRVSPQGRVSYLVRWLGWPSEYDQWRTVNQLANAQDLINDYEKDNADPVATATAQPHADEAPRPQRRGRPRRSD